MQYQTYKNNKISKEKKVSIYQSKNNINFNNKRENLELTQNSENTINNINPLDKSKDSNSIIHNTTYNLFSAVEYNDLEKAEQILKSDSSQINELNDEGISPLHISVIKGNLKMIDLLLRYGANSNIMSEKKKQTPLHLAYLNQNSMTEEILQELKNYNASDNVYDINNKKPSDYMNNSKNFSEKNNNNYNNTEDYSNSIDKQQMNSNTNTYMALTIDNHFDSFMTTNKEDDNKNNANSLNTNTIQTPSKLKEEGTNTIEYDYNNEPTISRNSNNKYNTNNTINSKSDSINKRQYTFGKDEDYHKFKVKNIKNSMSINILSNNNSIKDLDINYYHINNESQNGKENDLVEKRIQSYDVKENNQRKSPNNIETKNLEDEVKNELNDSLEDDLNNENYNINKNNTIQNTTRKNRNNYLNHINENSNSYKSSDNLMNIDSFTKNNGVISNSLLTYTDSINVNGSSQQSRKISPQGTITNSVTSNLKDNKDEIVLKLPSTTYNNNINILNNENISDNIINNNKDMSQDTIKEENNLHLNQNININIDNFYKKLILKKRDSIINSHRNCYSNISKFDLKNINLSTFNKINNNNTINANNYKNNSFTTQNSNTENTYINKTIMNNTSRDYNSSFINNTMIHNNKMNGIYEENMNNNESYYKSKENSDNKISFFTTKSQTNKLKANILKTDEICGNNLQNNGCQNEINHQSFIISNNNSGKNKFISEFKYIDSHINKNNIINTNYMNNSNDNSNINMNEIMNEDLNNSKNALSALKFWLNNIELINYYPNFINNSILDISNLIERMKSYQTKLKYENIESILKIRKPGHIYRILVRLEVDANLIDNKVIKFLLKNSKIFNKDEYYLNGGLDNNNNLHLLISQDYTCLGCCKTNKTFSNISKNDLKSFLKRYGLLNYYQNFYHNGFELIEYVILQMYGGYPINDDILENCFHVYDEEQRKNIMKAILCEIKKINEFLISEEYNNNQNMDLIKYENIIFYSENKNNEESKIIINNEKNSNCNIF